MSNGHTCGYGNWSNMMLPTRQHYLVKKVSLTNALRTECITFIGTSTEKLSTMSGAFYFSWTTIYIPIDIIEEFPSMNELEVSRSFVPIVFKKLFTSEFHFLKKP